MFRIPLTVCLIALLASVAAAQDRKVLRVGIIGLDTSHVPAFTKILNNPEAKGDLAGFKVVAAYPGGSPDIPSSRDRLEGFTKTLRDQYQVEIVDSIPTLLEKVDVVLLESVDGRPHRAQAEPVLRAGKPLFIDKPFAGSLADAVRIADLAREHKTPCFSSSSLRFYPGVQALRDNPKVGKVLGCDAWSPCSLEPNHPDLYWYGIHGVETLFAVMGPGCESVTRTTTKGTDHVTGLWKGGRIGTFRGLRDGKAGYGVTAFGDKGIEGTTLSGSYEPLVVEICKFFRTGTAPVSLDETVEIMAFMEAADESKRQNGAPVTLESVMTKARKQSAK